jgi:hypothetical protein
MQPTLETVERPARRTLTLKPEASARRKAMIAEQAPQPAEVRPTPVAKPAADQTPVVTAEQAQQDAVARGKQIQALHRQWRTDMPDVFNLDEPKPLVIGALGRLRERYSDTPWLTLRFAVERWVWRRAYRRAVAAEGSQRYALDGTPVGPVIAEHRAYAARSLGGQA